MLWTILLLIFPWCKVSALPKRAQLCTTKNLINGCPIPSLINSHDNFSSGRKVNHTFHLGGKHQLHSLGLKTENNKHQTKSRNTCWGQVRNENSLTKLIPLSILWTNQEYCYSSWKEYQSITASCLNFGQTHHWLHIYFTILQAWWREAASEWSVLTINLITLAKAWNFTIRFASPTTSTSTLTS